MPRRSPLEQAEFAVNPEPRCPCVLLLDTSGSMQGDRIDALNQGLQILREELVTDGLSSRRIEIAVVTFNSEVRVAQKFVTADQFAPPLLTAAGETHMASGIERALTLVEARKAVYRRNGVTYYRPWVFMITDGKPEGEPESAVAKATKHLREDEKAKRVAFFAVGVQDADMRRLGHIAVRTPLELEGLDFKGLFVWLSASMQAVSRSQAGEQVKLPPMGWLKRISVFIENNDEVIKDSISIAKLAARLAVGV